MTTSQTTVETTILTTDAIQAVFDQMHLATSYDRLRYAAPVQQATAQPFVTTISTSSTPSAP